MLTKILLVYSSILTTVLLAHMLAGSAAARTQAFDEIDVRRINVREPDGTLRLVKASPERCTVLAETTVKDAKGMPLLEPPAAAVDHLAHRDGLEASPAAAFLEPRVREHVLDQVPEPLFW